MNRQTLTYLALAVCTVTFGACVGVDPPSLYGDRAATSTAQEPPTTMPPKPMIKPYPSGPYGNMDGDVIENLIAEGYRLSPENNDSSTLVWQDGDGDTKKIELNDFYNKNDKVKCMLVSFGASWCGACQSEQMALPGEVSSDEAFGVLNILIEGPTNGSNKVSRQDVDDWTQKFMQNYPVVLGQQSMKSLWQGHDMNGSIGLPFNLVVRTSDMTIVGDAIQGFGAGLKDDAMARCAQ